MSPTLRAATLPALEAIPGLVHGFEQRLGPAGGETRGAGRERVTAALSGLGRLHLLKQVHGARVVEAPLAGRPEADAAVTSADGVLLGIETADCLPILIADPRRRVAAAVHAGWRGTAAGVAQGTVAVLVAAGSDAADLVCAVGPGIGPCCYEVGEELRAAFGAGADGLFRPGARGRPHLDLREANVHQLQAAGLRPDRIHHLDDCTVCRADLYHSYRRDGKRAGRMISWIGWARGFCSQA